MRTVTVSATVGVPDDYSDEEVRRMIQKMLEDSDGDIAAPEVLL
mgnify:CR=1 FL=1